MFDLRELLSSAVIYRQHRSKANEINICCPFCLERGETEDVRYRLGINVATGYAHCYNCEWRSRSLLYTVRELCRILELDYRIPIHQPEVVVAADELVVPAGLPREYETFAVVNESVGRAALKYLFSRGVSKEQIQKHKIGYAGAGEFSWRVIFPVFGEDKEIHGCVARAICPDVLPKYLNTVGSKLLWGAQYKAKTAVVVEGVLDALRVEHVLNGDAIACARLGSAVTQLQLKQLAKYKEIVVLADWDEPGVKGAIKLLEALVEMHYPGLCKVAVPDVMDDSDPGSMALDKLRKQLDCALAFTSITKLRLLAAATRRR